MNYPNLICCIVNAIVHKRSIISVPLSKSSLHLLKVLKEHKVISGFSVNTKHSKKNFKNLSIFFQNNTFQNNNYTLKNIVRSQNIINLSINDLVKFENTLLLLVLNTSSGVISHKQAIKKGIGGRLLAIIF